MNDFTECLEYSHSGSDLPFWREVYEKAFPGMAAMIDHRQDGEHQRAGIDRSIIMPNSKQILVDEKLRRKNKKTGQVYRDIALEYLSDESRRTPGWVCKPLRADFIAYAIAPIGQCYLLPVIQLQQAWRTHCELWVKTFPTIKAQNKSWMTVSVGVPVRDVFAAIGKALRIEFTPYDDDVAVAPVPALLARPSDRKPPFQQLLDQDTGPTW